MSYPTVANYKTWAEITGSGDDTEIGYALNGVIDAVEQYTRKVFVAASSTKNFPVRLPFVSGRWRVLNLLGLWLQSVASLTNGDGTTISASDYDLESPWGVDAPYTKVVLQDAAGIVFNDGGSSGRIALNGSWGWSAACPDDVFLAILRLTQAQMLARGQGSAGSVQFTGQAGTVLQPEGWPPDVVHMLARYKPV